MSGIGVVILVAVVMACALGGITLLAHIYNLNHIKSKTVGDGQHGTARHGALGDAGGNSKDIPSNPVHAAEMAGTGHAPGNAHGYTAEKGPERKARAAGHRRRVQRKKE